MKLSDWGVPIFISYVMWFALNFTQQKTVCTVVFYFLMKLFYHHKFDNEIMPYFSIQRMKNNQLKRVVPEFMSVCTTSNDLLWQTCQDATPHYLLFLDNSYVDVVQHTASKEQRRKSSALCATCAWQRLAAVNQNLLLIYDSFRKTALTRANAYRKASF